MLKKIYRAEPVATAVAGGVVGNGAMHEVLEAVNASGTAHSMAHALAVGCLGVVVRQSVYAPATVDQIKSADKAPPPTL